MSERYFCFGKQGICEEETCARCDFCDGEGGVKGETLDKIFKGLFGDEYDLDRLRELVQADRDERCIIPPVKIGDIVYLITTCKNFHQVLDGTMYGDDGGPGTATGMYCPCELAENCPFPCDYDGSFDCEKHKNTPAIFEDVVTGIYIDYVQDGVTFDYSGSADFEDFGKTVFMSREAAEAAMKGENENGMDQR